MGCVMSNLELVMTPFEKSAVTKVPETMEVGEMSPGTNMGDVNSPGV